MIKAFDKEIMLVSLVMAICFKLGVPEEAVRKIYDETAKINNKPTLAKDFKLW